MQCHSVANNMRNVHFVSTGEFVCCEFVALGVIWFDECFVSIWRYYLFSLMFSFTCFDIQTLIGIVYVGICQGQYIY